MRFVSATAFALLVTTLLWSLCGCEHDALRSGMDELEPRRAVTHATFVVEALEDAHWAVLEDEHAHALQVPRPWLPAHVREGDVLTVEVTPSDDGAVQGVVFAIDAVATDARRRAIEERWERLPRAPSGDLDL